MKYTTGYKYQLAETYKDTIPIYPASKISTDYICLDIDGVLVIFKGYAWDGASGPTFDTKNSMRGSLIHDALYQLMRMGLLDRSWRHAADKLLRDVCIEDGMFKLRAKLWYRGVRLGAGFAADPKNKKKILTVP